jgi:myosin-crossreactive antigen
MGYFPGYSCSGIASSLQRLDEYRLINDNDPNYSKARLIHNQGQIQISVNSVGEKRSAGYHLFTKEKRRT